jgi:hypothetical protein
MATTAPTCDKTGVRRKRILIAAPAALANTYDCPPEAFDGEAMIGGQSFLLLRLYPTPDGYLRRQRQRDRAGLQFNFARASYVPHRPWYDLELEITTHISSAPFRVLQAVHELHAVSGLGGGPTSLVTLYDYCRPDLGAWATAIAAETPLEPFTVRQGALELEEMGQVVGRATGPWSETEAVKIKFRQVG